MRSAHPVRKRFLDEVARATFSECNIVVLRREMRAKATLRKTCP
jgi:hypothetical protein